jgi:hypothetical protein
MGMGDGCMTGSGHGTRGVALVPLEEGRPPGNMAGEICPGASGNSETIIGRPEVTGCKVEKRGEGIASGPGPSVNGVPPAAADAASNTGSSGWFNSWGVGSSAAVGDIG